jgi:stage II sporulation protein D
MVTLQRQKTYPNSSNKFFMPYPLFTLLFFILFFLTNLTVSADPTRIRVALALNADRIQVSCWKGLRVYASGRKVFSGRTAYIQALYDRIFINGKKVFNRDILIAPNSSFYLRGGYYQGSLQVVLTNGSLDAINIISLQKYLESVIGSEMPSKWPIQALEAQAVAARTYALREIKAHQNSLYDLVSTYLAQAYNGLESVTPKTIQAVQRTRGEVLTYNNQLIMAYYSSDCGGRTESGADIFHKNIPYLQSVPCDFDQGAPHRRWEKVYTLRELSGIFGTRLHGLKIIKDPKTKHVVEVVLETERRNIHLPGYQFRKIMGTNQIRSTFFSLHMHSKIAYIPKVENLPPKKESKYILANSYVSIPVNRIKSMQIAENKAAHSKPVNSEDKTPHHKTPGESQVFMLNGKGEITEAEVTKQNPLVLITAGGWLSGGYRNLAFLFVGTKLMPEKKQEKKTIEVSQGTKTILIPTRVPNPDDITFYGRGWGHGLGLCQWGAKGMAELGKNYRQILHFFYHGVKIQVW